MAPHARLKQLQQVALALVVGVVMLLPVWFLIPSDKDSPWDEAEPIAVPMGKGAGVFSRDSLYAPLQERADVVSWHALTSVSTKVENNRVVTVYPPAVLALNARTQRIQGYMMPLNAGKTHRHFLLSSIPLACPFCTPGGPESMAEVSTRDPVAYTADALVLEGTFEVLSSDPSGMYYRMTNAATVR